MKTVTDEAVELLTKKELVERKLSELDFLTREQQHWSDDHYVTMNSIITKSITSLGNYSGNKKIPTIINNDC